MYIKKSVYSILCSLFSLPALFASNTAFAASCCAPFDGFYVSGSVGGINTDFTIDQQPRVTVPGGGGGGGITVTPNLESSAYNNTIMGAVGVGFNKTFCNRFLLGVEAVGDAENDASLNRHFRVRELMSGFFLANTTDSQLKNSFAVVFTPGVLLDCNTLLYGLVGPRWGRFTTSEFVANGTGGDTTSTITAIGTGDHTETKAGVTAGIGISRNITPHLSIGAEYDYTYYGRLSNPDDLTTTFVPSGSTTAGTLVSNTRIKIMTNTLMGTLTYRF